MGYPDLNSGSSICQCMSILRTAAVLKMDLPSMPFLKVSRHRKLCTMPCLGWSTCPEDPKCFQGTLMHPTSGATVRRYPAIEIPLPYMNSSRSTCSIQVLL